MVLWSMSGWWFMTPIPHPPGTCSFHPYSWGNPHLPLSICRVLVCIIYRGEKKRGDYFGSDMQFNLLSMLYDGMILTNTILLCSETLAMWLIIYQYSILCLLTEMGYRKDRGWGVHVVSNQPNRHSHFWQSQLPVQLRRLFFHPINWEKHGLDRELNVFQILLSMLHPLELRHLRKPPTIFFFPFNSNDFE